MFLFTFQLSAALLISRGLMVSGASWVLKGSSSQEGWICKEAGGRGEGEEKGKRRKGEGKRN